MKITILTIGKIKERYIKEGIDEYLKRLRPYAKIDVVELDSESFGKSDKEKKKEIEGQKILKYIEKNSDKLFVAMHERGKEYTSVNFAKFLDEEQREIVFIVGGSLGLSDDVLNIVNMQLALSQMTFLHEMTRLILIEQIYRSTMISKGKEYHY